MTANAGMDGPAAASGEIGTLLRRIMPLAREPDWTAIGIGIDIGIGFVIVVVGGVGVFLGLQVWNWNVQRADRTRGVVLAERRVAEPQRLRIAAGSTTGSPSGTSRRRVGLRAIAAGSGCASATCGGAGRRTVQAGRPVVVVATATYAVHPPRE